MENDFRHEALDAHRRRSLGELLEQPRPDPTALMLVGDREGGFCAAWVA